MAQDPEVFNARFEAFMRYKTTLIEQVHDHARNAHEDRSYQRPALSISKGELTLIYTSRYKINPTISALH